MVRHLAFAGALVMGLGSAHSGDRDAGVIRVATYNVDHGLDLPRLARALVEHDAALWVDVRWPEELSQESEHTRP